MKYLKADMFTAGCFITNGIAMFFPIDGFWTSVLRAIIAGAFIGIGLEAFKNGWKSGGKGRAE